MPPQCREPEPGICETAGPCATRGFRREAPHGGRIIITMMPLPLPAQMMGVSKLPLAGHPGQSLSKEGKRLGPELSGRGPPRRPIPARRASACSACLHHDHIIIIKPPPDDHDEPVA